jgi:hypothetical protein
MTFRIRLLALALLAVALGVPRDAGAQTTTSTPTLGPSAYKYPDRILPNNNDIGTGPRAQNLTPLGISYDDCMADQSLKFSISVSGFAGATDIQIWATKTGTCSNDSERGNGGVPDCWPLLGGMQGVNQVSTNTLPFQVSARDIIGPQNAPPNPPVQKNYGPEACTSQLSYSSETFSVWFIPIQNGNQAVGTAYSYQLPVDLVGPPAPTGVTDQVGDTLMTLGWTPNSDTDTTGYNVYIDPIPGHEGAAAPSDAAPVSTPEPILVCPDTGAPPPVTTEAGTDATTAPGADAAVPDAGCHYVNVTNTPEAGACNNSLLAGGIVQEGGTTTVPVSGDSGVDDGSTTVVPTGGGGISTVPSANLVGASGSGLTISDKSTGTYTITGLKNGTTYTLVVSAVDAFGNIGPPSAQTCDYPAPVNDFWTNYRGDGGRAGGFCALEAVGAAPASAFAAGAFVFAAGVFARRRRGRAK